MRPSVVVHVATSLDGRTTGFDVDLGLYYRLARTFDEDATLTGADTMLAAPLDSLPAAEPSPDAPLLVVTDSRGRVRSWDRLLASGLWRAGVALCTRATPPEHLEHLASIGVDVVVAGDERVDLGAALAELGDRFGVRRVRVDSGGSLARALLEAGVVDEVSVVLVPALVEPRAELRLEQAEPQPGGVVWLRYATRRA